MDSYHPWPFSYLCGQNRGMQISTARQYRKSKLDQLLQIIKKAVCCKNVSTNSITVNVLLKKTKVNLSTNGKVKE